MLRAIISILILLFEVSVANAQRINFRTFVQDEAITVTVVDNPAGLNFNLIHPILVVGDPAVFNILLTDFATVVVEIDAPLEYDLTVEFNWSKGLSYLGSDTGVTVPFGLRFAYSNTGELTDAERRMTAVEVPPMFHTVTLPVRRRRAGGPPLPPPTPEHGGFVRPRGKAYLYIYGSLGPIPTGIRSGIYNGQVDINISYADNSF